MLAEEVLKKVEKIVEEVCAREGCRLYDLEFGGAGQGRTLKIMIDKIGGGVGIDDCSNVSKGVNLLLDVEDIIPGGAYHLEVSSPGVDKVLKKPWHYETMVGKKIWMKLNQALGNLASVDEGLKSAKQITEELLKADENGIVVKIKSTEINIPYSSIEKAKAVFEYGPQPKKGKK